jgi:hypothetical protein
VELKVVLDEYQVNDWGDTISQVLKDEVVSQLRIVARNEVKAHKAEWEKKVRESVKKLMKSLEPDMIAKIAREAIK